LEAAEKKRRAADFRTFLELNLEERGDSLEHVS